MRKFIFLFIVMLLCACASPYKPHGIGGGYDDTKLAPNVFRVSFRGNGSTSMERAKDYALLRCAELCLANGFKYFAIANDTSYVKTDSTYIPGQTYTSYSGTTTAQAMPNGMIDMTTCGRSTSFATPGIDFDVDNPHAVFLVVGAYTKDAFPNMFDAAYLRNSIRTKYKIGN